MRRKRQVKLATKPLTVEIKREHIAQGVPGDKCNCAVAQALQDKFGETVDGFEVGGNRTKIHFDAGGSTFVYRTPVLLRRALPAFDKTGHWNLPVGKFQLLPINIQPQHTPNVIAKNKPKRPTYIPTRKASIKF